MYIRIRLIYALFAQSSKMETVTTGFEPTIFSLDFRACWRSRLSARVSESQN